MKISLCIVIFAIIENFVRSGHRWFIIIIITTTPFEVEGREVGCPTVYEVYMVRYIVGFCVNNNHLSWGS